ncbi:hypothetical protein SAMN05421505_104276 [Sinosporangium album]|uniref:Uncharacterized protein n=1 Tax=Sinosporangium album TaxID=504805 RepID=A0A1G7UJX1_9ACTN|nr:hypothetical protein [Sinosporangium album]SDG47399.1 hypothetical protein SAMN05421505_104276 [Sinosporangium album]
MSDQSISTADAAAFAQALKVPPMPPKLRDAAATTAAVQQTTGESASVVGNSMVAFTADVSPQHKDDLLNSFGLAQLSAVAQGADAEADPVDYYRKVVKVLTNIGYTGQAINFAKYATQTATVRIDQVVIDIMAALVTGPELEIVKAALTALKSSADANGAPWQLYHSQSTSDTNGSFSIGLANETNNNVAVKLSAFHFTGNETATKFLWMSYSSTSVDIQQGQTTLVLNDSVYSGVRNTVLKKMSSHASSYIDNLPEL